MKEKTTCETCGYFGHDIHDDIYDCQEQWEVENGIPKGQWMIDWIKRLQEKEPYVSDFVKWSSKH